MAELKSQQQEAQINGGAQLSVATNAVAAETITTKRQRRPSVRLGDIGDQPAAAGRARQWKLPSKEAKSSKTRPMTNLGGGYYRHETLDGVEREREWKVKDSKPKRGLKRLRTNWALKIEEGGGNDGDGVEKISGAEDGEDVFVRDFEMVGSESPLKEQSPVHSVENLGVDGDDRGHGGDRELHFRRPHNSRGRIDDGRDHDGDDDDDDDHGVELDGPSDNSRGHSGRRWRGENGVRIWLNGLGLGRYWPVFEIHEVDDEVLPLLTLEDLKDMGINAVGSRRKMYCAIQKLSKGFS